MGAGRSKRPLRSIRSEAQPGPPFAALLIQRLIVELSRGLFEGLIQGLIRGLLWEQRCPLGALHPPVAGT